MQNCDICIARKLKNSGYVEEEKNMSEDDIVFRKSQIDNPEKWDSIDTDVILEKGTLSAKNRYYSRIIYGRESSAVADYVSELESDIKFLLSVLPASFQHHRVMELKKEFADGE